MSIATIHTFAIAEIEIEVVRKHIKNLHLHIHPPAGNVRISAPVRMSSDTIRNFAISKLDWIRKHQTHLRNQTRSAPLSYTYGENHYLWGKLYILQIIEIAAPPRVEIQSDRILLQVHPNSDVAEKRAILDEFYRQQLEVAIRPLIAKWEQSIGVSVVSFSVRKMKTKWGSCTPALQTMRFNLELTKKPAACLEYVIVHELVHLLEPSHNHRFTALMDSFLPQWRLDRIELNRIPIDDPD